MAQFRVTDSETGESFLITGDQEPTQAEVQELIQTQQAPPPTEEQQSAPQESQTPEEDIIRFDPFIAAKNIAQGVREKGQGLEQFFTEIFNPEELEEVTKRISQQREEFQQTPASEGITANVSRFLGKTGPDLLIPGGVAGGIAKRIGTGALSGAAIGGTEFTKEGERGTEALIGGAIGGAFPAVTETAKLGFKIAQKAFGKTQSLVGSSKDARIIKEATGGELTPETIDRIQAGKEFGLDLSPAEATRSAKLARIQGEGGQSERGFELIETAGKRRVAQEEKAVRDFLFEVSPTGASANRKLINLSNKIVDDKKKALALAAKPFYESAKNDEIPKRLLEETFTDNPIIKGAYDEVFSNRNFFKEIKGAPLNSIRALDLAKKQLDGLIEGKKFRDKNDNLNFEGIQIVKARNQLLNLADNFSTDYFIARQIFSNEAPAFQKLLGSPIGKISRLSDDASKRVSQTVFDISQTNPQVFKTLSKTIGKEDPDAIPQLMRNEIERRLDSVGADRDVTTLFKQVVNRERDFKMFDTFTQGRPSMNKALRNLKKIGKDLIRPEVSVKTSAAQSRQATNQQRNDFNQARTELIQLGLDNRDIALTEVFTNPRWHDELADVLKEESKIKRFPKIVNFLTKVSNASKATAETGERFGGRALASEFTGE